MTATTLPDLDLLVYDGAAHLPRRLASDSHEAHLVELYRYPDRAEGKPRPADGAQQTPGAPRRVGAAVNRPGVVVRANMVSSVDGGAWGPDHRSRSINNAADWRVFRVLRALADVVVVGAGTARAEGYGQISTPKGLEYLRSTPLELALVTWSGQIPGQLATAANPPYVLTGRIGAKRAQALGVPADRTIVVEHENDMTPGLDLAAGLAALAGRGLENVLCEGGPTLLTDMLNAGLVDELCLTVTPVLVGPEPGRIVAPTGQATAPPSNAALAHLLHSAGTILTRWLLP